MIEVKMQDIVNGTEALQSLAKKEMKARLAYTISKLLKSADAELTNFNETRLNLIKKYGEKDEAGELLTDEKGNCKIAPESVSDFTNELNDLLNTSIELNANKININDLDSLNFTPLELNNLEGFIEMDE